MTCQVPGGPRPESDPCNKLLKAAMPIFHIRTVTNFADEPRGERSGLPSGPPCAGPNRDPVQYGDYLVFAPSLRAAYESVCDSPMVICAAEVWGAVRVLQRDGVIVRPNVLLHERTTWHAHWQWRASQDRYALLAEAASGAPVVWRRHETQRPAGARSGLQVDGIPTS